MNTEESLSKENETKLRNQEKIFIILNSLQIQILNSSHGIHTQGVIPHHHAGKAAGLGRGDQHALILRRCPRQCLGRRAEITGFSAHGNLISCPSPDVICVISRRDLGWSPSRSGPCTAMSTAMRTTPSGAEYVTRCATALTYNRCPSGQVDSNGLHMTTRTRHMGAVPGLWVQPWPPDALRPCRDR